MNEERKTHCKQYRHNRSFQNILLPANWSSR